MPKRSRSPSPLPNTSQSPPAHVPRVSVETPNQPAIFCNFFPTCNGIPFDTHEAYDVHYQKTHTNRCSECQLNFPSERYLQLHIRENHDPLVMVLWERGERIYECYVDGCDKVCKNRGRRRLHLMGKHGFPENYNWAIIDNGIDGCTSLLRSGWESRKQFIPEQTPQCQPRPSRITKPTPKAHIRFSDPEETNGQMIVENPRITNINGDASGGGVNSLVKGISSMSLVPRSVQLKKRGH